MLPFFRPHTVSTSVQVNGGRVAGSSSNSSRVAAAQETAQVAGSSSSYFPQQPVNFYTNSLYLATAPESPWTFYPQAHTNTST